MEYSIVGRAATNQRAKSYEIHVNAARKLANLRSYRRYTHGHTVVDELELVTLSDIPDVKNRLTKLSKNTSNQRKKLFTRSNDGIEKA
ncbi:hypothetical protein XI08_15115 [Bradyrhizobium sp. CCBAU 11361]|nr:hypothetical protein [Bradyrhizobium sp. CCBAU 11361]